MTWSHADLSCETFAARSAKAAASPPRRVSLILPRRSLPGDCDPPVAAEDRHRHVGAGCSVVDDIDDAGSVQPGARRTVDGDDHVAEEDARLRGGTIGLNDGDPRRRYAPIEVDADGCRPARPQLRAE